jgi:hypothetical protein
VGFELHRPDGPLPPPVTVAQAMLMRVGTVTRISAPGAMHLLPAGAVVKAPGVSGPEFARVVVNDGRYAWLDRSLRAAGRQDIVVYRPATTDLLAVGTEGAENMGVMSAGLVAPAAGTYYLCVWGDAATEYSLAFVRGAAFDAEPNGNLAGAQDLTGIGAALGFVGAADEGDCYRLYAHAGDVLAAVTRTPPGGPCGLGGELDPAVTVYSPGGYAVAADDG